MEDAVDNFLLLVGAGFSPDEAVAIAVDAAEVYDRNRKARGAISGALGMLGCEIYSALCRTPDWERDPEAFALYRPFTAEALAGRLRRSSGAVGSAVRRLIEHGFIDKRREGRSFSIRLLVPRLALTEYGKSYAGTDAAPGTFAYEHYRPLGERVLRLFPPAAATR